MLKIGLIGCGFMGRTHAACYNVIEGAEIVAVADIRHEKAKKIANGNDIEIYTTGIELIENADVDVIDICLPTYMHTEHAVAAMKKVKNVFIEKPVCISSEEGKLLLTTEKETGANVQIGQVVRCWNEYAWVKEAVVNNTYGRVLSASFRRLSPYPTWAWENWLHDAKRSGSVALDLHIHDVDFMRYLMGEPDSLASTVTRDKNGLVSHIFTTFRYDDATILVEASWNYPVDFPFDASFLVEFENATAVYNENGLNVYLKDGGVVTPELVSAFEDSNDTDGNISSLGGYFTELKYFVDKVNAGEKLTLAPLCEGVKSVELILDELAFVGGAQK